MKAERTLLECHGCRHIFWDVFPRPDELAAYYAKVYTSQKSQQALQEQNRAYYRTHLQELLVLCGRKAPAEVTLMDYGCSVPVLLEEAAQLGFRRAIGVDYAEGETAVEMIPPEGVGGLPDQSVDVVRFSHTLEHIPDPLNTLRTLLPKMRRGALLYVTQPSFPVFATAAAGFDLKDSVYPEHLHFFSPISLVKLAREAGFKVTRLFTHQREKAIFDETRSLLDLDYARAELLNLRDKGDPNFPELANYPYYCGENSVLHAVRPGSWFF